MKTSLFCFTLKTANMNVVLAKIFELIQPSTILIKFRAARRELATTVLYAAMLHTIEECAENTFCAESDKNGLVGRH